MYIKKYKERKERESNTHSKRRRRQAYGRVEENKESWKWSFS